MLIFHSGTNIPECETGQTLSHCGKQTSRLALMSQLARSGWGANVAVGRTAALVLVYSTAKYCAPIWCCSVHTCIIDTAINDTLRVLTRCLRPTPLDNLPILAGIHSAELRRRQAMLSLSCLALVPDHLLYHKLADPAKQPL